MSRLYVQPGIVADRIARLQAITIRSENPSTWSNSPQPHSQLGSSSGDFLKLHPTDSDGALRSSRSQRMLANYVNNDTLVRHYGPCKPGVASSISSLRISALDGADTPSSASPSSHALPMSSVVLPLNFSKSKQAIDDQHSSTYQQEAANSKEHLSLSASGLDIAEPIPKTGPPVHQTIAAQIEKQVQRVSMPNWGSGSAISLVDEEASHPIWASVDTPEAEVTAAADSLPSLCRWPAPTNDTSEIRWAPASEHAQPVVPSRERELARPNNKDLRKRHSARSTIGKRLKHRITSLKKSSKDTKPANEGKPPFDVDTIHDAAGTPSINVKKHKGQSKRRQPSLRLFSKGSKSPTDSSESQSRPESDAGAVKDVNIKDTTNPSGQSHDQSRQSSLHLLYSSPTIDLKQCAQSHESVEIKDSHGKCVVAMYVSGSRKPDLLRLEMSPNPSVSRYRRCEACDHC